MKENVSSLLNSAGKLVREDLKTNFGKKITELLNASFAFHLTGKAMRLCLVANRGMSCNPMLLGLSWGEFM